MFYIFLRKAIGWRQMILLLHFFRVFATSNENCLFSSHSCTVPLSPIVLRRIYERITCCEEETSLLVDVRWIPFRTCLATTGDKTYVDVASAKMQLPSEYVGCYSAGKTLLRDNVCWIFFETYGNSGQQRGSSVRTQLKVERGE